MSERIACQIAQQACHSVAGHRHRESAFFELVASCSDREPSESDVHVEHVYHVPSTWHVSNLPYFWQTASVTKLPLCGRCPTIVHADGRRTFRLVLAAFLRLISYRQSKPSHDSGSDHSPDSSFQRSLHTPSLCELLLLTPASFLELRSLPRAFLITTIAHLTTCGCVQFLARSPRLPRCLMRLNTCPTCS